MVWIVIPGNPANSTSGPSWGAGGLAFLSTCPKLHLSEILNLPLSLLPLSSISSTTCLLVLITARQLTSATLTFILPKADCHPTVTLSNTSMLVCVPCSPKCLSPSFCSCHSPYPTCHSPLAGHAQRQCLPSNKLASHWLACVYVLWQKPAGTDIAGDK